VIALFFTTLPPPTSTLSPYTTLFRSLGAKVALEFEFFVFRETRESLVSKNFTNLEPLDPGMFGYSWLRTGQDAELMADLQDTLRSEEHTSELQSRENLVCRLLLEKKK